MSRSNLCMYKSSCCSSFTAGTSDEENQTSELSESDSAAIATAAAFSESDSQTAAAFSTATSFGAAFLAAAFVVTNSGFLVTAPFFEVAVAALAVGLLAPRFYNCMHPGMRSLASRSHTGIQIDLLCDRIDVLRCGRMCDQGDKRSSCLCGMTSCLLYVDQGHL